VLQEFRERLERDTRALEDAGLLKRERIIGSAQGPVVRLADGREMINLCANNYLGLANHPAVLQAAHDALSRFGYGVASVRFICGTQSVHRELEERLSGYLGMEDTILYSSCFDANGGLFETLLDAEDAVISDALNHASIIDGIRLSKARRLRYANNDLNELEQALKDSQDARVRLIATDGVFSMDGSIAKLREICDLASRYGALVMVDDSHATGFIGARGRGSHELRGVMDKVDIMTGTLG
jgi:glycine C-acetyltransferase